MSERSKFLKINNEIEQYLIMSLLNINALFVYFQNYFLKIVIIHFKLKKEGLKKFTIIR